MKRNTRSIVRVNLVVLFLILFLVPQFALADKKRHHHRSDRYVINFEDSYFRGYRDGPATLHLKRLLKSQYPGLNIRDYRLRKVVLVGKTKRGLGSAQLRVGSEATNFYTVAGHPRDFHYDHRGTFDKVRFRNPSRGSRGPWQLFLRGKFKVRKVVVEVERKRRQNNNWSYNERPSRNHFDRWSHDGRLDVNARW